MQTHMDIRFRTHPVSLAVRTTGSGRACLLLHGGAGPLSLYGLGDALSETGLAIVPTHPGFNGEPRPDDVARVADLAELYLELLRQLDVSDVVVVGNSFGGWIAAEMALADPSRLSGVVLLNAVGIAPDPHEQPIVDPSQVEPSRRAALAFHDPARFAVAPATPEALALLAANQASFRVYAGASMCDPGLQARLDGFRLPALMIWGESDRIVDIGYGRRFAASLGARFLPVEKAGHFPQIEQRERVVEAIRAFAEDVRSGT